MRQVELTRVAARPPGATSNDRIERNSAFGLYSMSSRKRSQNKKSRRAEKLKALGIESDLALRDQIRRLIAKPPHERTHFLRKRIGLNGSCL